MSTYLVMMSFGVNYEDGYVVGAFFGSHAPLYGFKGVLVVCGMN